MNTLEEISVRLAEQVAPDEVDLAPDIATVAAQGGKEWEDLVRPRKGPVLGGIVSELAGGNFVQIISVMKDCVALLIDLCTLGLTIYSFLEWLDRKQDNTKKRLPPDAQDLLDTTRTKISQGLIDRGLEPSQAQKIACVMIKTLVKDPEKGKEFLMLVDPRNNPANLRKR